MNKENKKFATCVKKLFRKFATQLVTQLFTGCDEISIFKWKVDKLTFFIKVSDFKDLKEEASLIVLLHKVLDFGSKENVSFTEEETERIRHKRLPFTLPETFTKMQQPFLK